MVFRFRPALALLAPVLLAATLSCGRSEPKNEVTRNGEDVLASGGAPNVPDSVPGDAIMAGGDVRFSGATGGDYLGVGGKQAISGRIHGSVRAAGGDVQVTATVDRNATIWLGRRVLGARALTGRQGVLVSFLVGGLILLIVGIVPMIGSWLMVIATVLGLGTLLLRAQALRERQPT